MALRRPAAPRVRPGRPGAPAAPPRPVPAPAIARPVASGTPAPSVAPAASASPLRTIPEGPAVSAVSADTAGAPRPAASGTRTPPRRTLLLAGATAAATAGVVAAGVLATRALDPAAGPFSDMADGDAELGAMTWADENGVLPATDGDLSPEGAVTRGELAVALHRFAGTPAVPLEDVPVLIVDLGEDPEQASALLWLHGRGALWGDAELKVHPGDPATRTCAAEMLAALLRPALAGVGAVWTSEDEDDGALPLDAAWLTRAGMLPRPEGDWDGDSTVTRAELATVLQRADGIIAEALEGAG